jgi:hypothetical protein
MSANPFLLAEDPFDSLLNKVCSVWKKGATGQEDNYGNEIQEFDLLLDDVPCYVEQIKGQELNTPPAATSQTSFGVLQYRIYMRPITVDVPAVPLNQHHWLQIRDQGTVNLNPNDSTSGAVMHNITHVEDPGQQGHHLEVETTVILP